MRNILRVASMSCALLATAAIAQTQETPRTQQGMQGQAQHGGHSGQSQQGGHSSQRYQGGQGSQMQGSQGGSHEGNDGETGARGTAGDCTRADRDVGTDNNCEGLTGQQRQDCMDREGRTGAPTGARAADDRDGGRR